MRIVINSFEGDFAICQKESNKTICIKRDRLPKIAKERDVLNIACGEISIDVVETKKRKLKI
jgi:hypothetical protein